MIVYLEDDAENRIGYVITTGRSFKDGYEIDTGIDIQYYSNILLKLPKEKQNKFIRKINKLINYKVYFWNKHEGSIRNIKTKTLDKELLKFIKSICDEFNLKINIRFVEGISIENI